MGYETFKLSYREPTREEIEEMDFYLRTGCVHNDYLRDVLGDQSVFVGNNPRRIEEVLEMFE
ncbi:MAG: hypothetical protein AABW67_03575 [Nanoarchaeota archaeon]